MKTAGFLPRSVCEKLEKLPLDETPKPNTEYFYQKYIVTTYF